MAPTKPPQQASGSKVKRSRSLTKPDRQRPKTGMLSRNPSQKTQDAPFHDMNESTGNLIQIQTSSPTTSATATNSTSTSSGPPLSPTHQHPHQRLRIQEGPTLPMHQFPPGHGPPQQQPQTRPRPKRSSTLRRASSSRGPPGSAPQRRPSTLQKAKKKFQEREIELTAWVIVSRIFTCCIPAGFLRCCNGKKFSRDQVVQAWREKVTLCMIIALICAVLAFVIFGLQPTLCPGGGGDRLSYVIGSNYDAVIVKGSAYYFEDMQDFLRGKNIPMSPDYRSRDISQLFYDASMPCNSFPGINVTTTQCTVPNPYLNSPIVARPCLTFRDLEVAKIKPKGRISFQWTELKDSNKKDLDYTVVYDGRVFNATRFVGPNKLLGDDMTAVIEGNLRKDASLPFARSESRKKAIACLEAVTEVGSLEGTTMGCFAATTIMVTTLVCVSLVVGIKFLMALTFSWFLSYRLTEKPRAVLKSKKEKEDPNNPDKDTARSQKGARKNLYTAMLVTCYSEGENSIRTTLDSLANTSYSNKHKLIVVICDGIVRGHGNKMTTPDIVVKMLDLAPGTENPKASSYLAIADGEKQHNMAKVYAGHYVYKKKRVPTVVIVKCGNPLEKDATKPGNRGKRDSQLILMSFFQRVLFADRFTELDFELFHSIHTLMGVWADRFELCLMVDADTMVKGDSLSYMVTAMQNDHTIMGLCGETKIANKTASWVTAIQVFEYYISHHLGKAFESVFGGVTCLPGCFCMYRIKSPKNDSWVPILANPEIIQEYNQNIVSTLHQKNLLLLGEDRYLTTLMLRTFPKRQMVFVPQAQCKTVVPDTFKVLLSQRRRWINSTIHNLLELVLVTDLCGIAFLSMQFVVLLELIGTIVLPAAILFTIGMITYSIITNSFTILPLILIIVIIGLPAVLIVLTTRKWVYVLWMLMYLISLPIWNFVLPLYSFWHFDDFSWGETRKVANQKRKSGQDHGDAEGVFESGSIIMRKWEEWEKERLKAMGYRIQRRHSADRGINDLPPPAASTMNLHKAPRKAASTANLANGRSKTVNQGPLGSGGRSAAAAASTNSLGSTLNGSGGGSGRTGTPTGQRHITSSPMPQSTPNLPLSHQQQQQQQQQQLRQSISMAGRPAPRPRPPPQHMMGRPPSGSIAPGQSFELGAMNSGGPNRASFIPVGPGAPGRPPPGSMPTTSLEARHSIHGGPGFRPRPMRPMGPNLSAGPGGPFPVSRPPASHPGYMPSARPRPSPGGYTSGPMQHPPPPALLFPNMQQQQHQQDPSQTPYYPAPSSTPAMSQQSSNGGGDPSYPIPPPSTAGSGGQLLFPGDRNSRMSEMSAQSGLSSGGRSAAHGSVATTAVPPPNIQQQQMEDGVVLLSEKP